MRYLFFFLFLFSCSTKPTVSEQSKPNWIPIPTNAKISHYKAEISAMTWLGDKLVLVPENANSYSENNFFYLNRADIKEWLHNGVKPAIKTIKTIGDFENKVEGFDGFEAMAVVADTVYVAMEALGLGWTRSWLAKGIYNTGLNQIEFDMNSLKEVPIPGKIFNAGIESLTYYDKTVWALYEANGRNINKTPTCYKYSSRLSFLGEAPFPAIEFRVTDATETDNSGTFWAINYFYSGDKKKYKPAPDNLLPKTDLNKQKFVERLVKFKFEDGKIMIADRNSWPIFSGDLGEINWEGVARWDEKSILLINDMYPKSVGTVLVYLEKK